MATSSLFRCVPLVALLALASAPAQADIRTPAQVQAAKEFKMDSIHLWMKKADLEQLYPSLKPFADFTDAKKELEGLKIDKTANTDGVELAFWSGRLTQYRLWLNAERMQQMGGVQAIIAQLVELFGQPDRAPASAPGSTGRSCQWKIEDASFSCTLTAMPDATVIAISDTGLLNEGIFSHAAKEPTTAR